jgi:hypothetical protein
MRITSTGNVGIGNDAPDGYAAATKLIVGDESVDTENTGISIICGGTGMLTFGDGTGDPDSQQGLVTYAHGIDTMYLYTANNARLHIDSSGDFTGSSSADISDARFKENVVELTGCLAQINALRGISYNFTPAAEKNDMLRYGLLAQEVEAVIPAIVWDKSIHDIEAVEAADAVLYVEGDEIPEGQNIGDVKTPAVEAVEEERFKSLHYTGLIPVFIEAIKELTARLGAAEAKITALESA